MELQLTYPIGATSKVMVGIITGDIKENFADPNDLLTGQFVFKLFKAVTYDLDEKLIPMISSVDANRIMLAAWKQTYQKDKFEDIKYCSECKTNNRIVFDLDLKSQADEMYSKPLNFSGPSLEPPFASRQYEVKLRPLTLADQVGLLAAGEDPLEVVRLSMNSFIESVDGDANKGAKDLPLPIQQKIEGMVAEDILAATSYLTKEQKCMSPSCEAVLNSSIGWSDGSFLTDGDVGK